MMNRFRSLVVVGLLLFAFGAWAQQSSAGSSDAAKPDQQAGASAVDQHLQMMTEKLNLSADQQAKLRPIIKEMLDGRQKLLNDTSLSDEQRHQKMKALHEQAIQQCRQYLSAEQNKKLDELQAEHHHEQHTN
jgi:periplasmic protein CpxP/Spy